MTFGDLCANNFDVAAKSPKNAAKAPATLQNQVGKVLLTLASTLVTKIMLSVMCGTSTGILGESDWPSTGPTPPEVDLAASAIGSSISNISRLKSLLSQARATLHAQIDTGVGLMKRVDEVTDGLYGSDSPKKNDFGLPPKKSTHGASIPLEQVVIIKIEDGTAPASIFVDWNSDAGAIAYQIEWFTDSAMTQSVGSAAVSASEHEIQGLTMSQQYWVRVRSVRGNENGQWSDPATRVANL